MTWQPKSSQTVETSHWTSSNMDSVPLHSSSRLWDLDFQIKCNIYFNLKRVLWTTEQQSSFFLLSPGKMLLTCFCFRSGLVPFSWRCQSVDSWCTHSSFSPLLVSSPKCLNRLCLTVFSSLRSSLLLVHISLPNFFLPVNFALNMLWYSTPWTATLSVMTLCDLPSLWGVNDRLLDHCQVSSVPHYCGFKEQEIPRIYNLWMVIYWNSNVNILIFWETDFWLSLAVSSNQQNWNKKTLKCFTFHVMNLKYMKVSLFEISYKKTFSPYSIFCDIPVYAGG